MRYTRDTLLLNVCCYVCCHVCLSVEYHTSASAAQNSKGGESWRELNGYALGFYRLHITAPTPV